MNNPTASENTNALHPNSSHNIYIEAKQFIVLALPIIIALLSQTLLGFIDIVMLGRYNELDFAAASLGANLNLFVIIVSGGLLMGLSPLISHSRGAGDQESIRHYFQQGAWLAILIGLSFAFINYFMGYLLVFLNINEALINRTFDYIWIVSFAVPFVNLYLVPKYFCEAVEVSLPMMVIQLLMLPLNIIINYLFIYGNLGFPEMGAKGAAIATLCVHIFSAISIWVYVLSSKKYTCYALFKQVSLPQVKTIKQIFILSLPIALALAFETGLFMVSSMLMGKFGETAVAAHQVAINYAELMFMVPLGVSMAITVKVSHAIGRNQYSYARFRAKVGIYMATGFMLLSSAVLFIFPGFIVSIYTHYDSIADLAISFLFFAAIFQVVDGVQVSIMGVLRGYKDTAIPMILTFVSYWVVGLGSALLLAFYLKMSGQGLWLGLIIGLSAAAILLYFRMSSIFNRYILLDDE